MSVWLRNLFCIHSIVCHKSIYIFLEGKNTKVLLILSCLILLTITNNCIHYYNLRFNHYLIQNTFINIFHFLFRICYMSIPQIAYNVILIFSCLHFFLFDSNNFQRCMLMIFKPWSFVSEKQLVDTTWACLFCFKCCHVSFQSYVYISKQKRRYNLILFAWNVVNY